eukprot:g269.t1
MPAFSWSTTPVFQQLCNVNGTYSAEFSPAKIAWLAKHFPLITLEHCQGQGPETYAGQVLQHGYIEDHYLAAAKQIKQANSSTTVLYYNNQDSALPYYRMARPLYEDHPEWAAQGCHGGGGHMFPNLTDKCYNLSVPEVQSSWRTHFANMTKAGSPLDGMFVDVEQGNHGKFVTSFFGSLQAANPGKIVGHVADLSSDVPYRLKQTYKFGADHDNIDALQRCARTGDTICEAHMQFEFDGSQQPGSAVNLIPLTFNATLAAFLVAAGEYSYFSFSTKTKQLGAGFCGGPTPTWCYGMGWSDDFLRPLGGPPDGPANRSGDTYTRTFGGGKTKVMLEIGQACRIDWVDGHATVCNTAPAPAPGPAPSPNSTSCMYEQETGYGDETIRSVYVQNSKSDPHSGREECCRVCKDEPACKVAVMDKHNKTTSGMACYLKATADKILTGREGLVSCHPQHREELKLPPAGSGVRE